MRHTMHTIISGKAFRQTLIAGCVAALCSGGAWAAQGDVLSLSVGQDYTYDSNVFRVADGQNPSGYSHRSDSIWTTHASAALDKEFGRQRITASLGGGHVSYGSFSHLNHDRNAIQLGWRLGFGTASEVGVSYNRAENIGRFEDRTGFSQRNMVTSESLAADLMLRVAGDWLGVGSVAKGSYENSVDTLRSGDSEVLSSDLGVRYAPRNGNYVDFRVRKSDFEYNRVPAGSADYSYEQRELRLTGRWKPNGVSTLEPGVSLVRSRHDSQTALDYTGWTGFLAYTWKPTGALSETLRVAREVGAVGDAWGSYARTYGISSNTRWQTTAKLGLFLDASWRAQSFRGFQNLNQADGGRRLDYLWSLGLGADYLLSDKFILALSVKDMDRRSNKAVYSYSDQQVQLSGQYKF